MKVNGRDLHVRKESNLVEQDRTTSIVCHVEAIRQELVLEVLNCFLEGNDVPLLRIVLFDCSSFSTSKSWVPIKGTEPSLFGQPVGHVAVKMIFLVHDGECFLAGASRYAGLAPFASAM